MHNKIDLLDDEARAALSARLARHGDGAMVSALTGEGRDALLALLDTRLSAQRLRVRLSVPLTDGAALAWLHAHGEVIGREDGDSDCYMDVRLEAADLDRFERRFGYRPAREAPDLADAAEA